MLAYYRFALRVERNRAKLNEKYLIECFLLKKMIVMTISRVLEKKEMEKNLGDIYL